MPFSHSAIENFLDLDAPKLINSSYKNLGYPLGCSASELDAALEDGDFTLKNTQSETIGFARVKAMFEGICYFDFCLIKDHESDSIVQEMLDAFRRSYQIGKFYVQLLPYEDLEVACLSRLGFTEEARLRKQLFVNGAYHDLLMMGSIDHRV